MTSGLMILLQILTINFQTVRRVRMYVAKYFFCLYFLLYDQLIFIYVGNLSQLGGHNGVGNEGGTDTSNAPVVDLEEQTPRQSRRKPPTVLKNVSRRGGGFTKEEDAIICSAFLNVSKDAVVGVN